MQDKTGTVAYFRERLLPRPRHACKNR